MAEWDEDALALLRAAAYRRDPAAGLPLLADRPLGPVLQYAGDVLVAALERDGPGAAGAVRLARECAAELTGRGLAGDAELAAELAGALAGEPPELADAPVELSMLGLLMDADPAEGAQVVDLRTGDIGPDIAVGDEPRRWLMFWPQGPAGSAEASGSAEFAEEERRGRARQWLAAHGFRSRPHFL
ncbi:hypothetical protein [Spirillospora sp. NPDC029432]|uniref:hypothetical protein n=1 Tax=Spirillospora sp. NPDC029432 TaxID=3154599 RepID=UPI003454EF81